MEKICMYLRKSRADEEIEKNIGAMETLSKHRKALLKYAKENELNIIEIKEEIVSGESLFHRPKMLELLQELESGKYNGVLVMDMQRLGRGDMQEQGLILNAFKNSNTLIITPQKTYNLRNEFDEEYSEFEAFMSRKELKMINKRMQGGRIRSVQDGNYIGTNPPLGYDIHFINKNRTLKVNEVESEAIQIIFENYCTGVGASAIADKLNNLGYKTKISGYFTSSSILAIIKNPIYVGLVTWKKKEIKKSNTLGKSKDTRTRPREEWIIAQGKHKPLITQEMWDLSQEILKNKYHIPYQLTNKPVNPLAGLLVCSGCGKKMTMRKLRGINRVLCTNKQCNNKSNSFDPVEKYLLNELTHYINTVKINNENNLYEADEVNPHEKELILLEKELKTLDSQRLSLFDYLERGIYTEQIFLERSKNIDTRIIKVKEEINKVALKMTEKKKYNDLTEMIIEFEKILETYSKTDDIGLKNSLLKSILYKIEYTKLPTAPKDNFHLNIYPRL